MKHYVGEMEVHSAIDRDGEAAFWVVINGVEFVCRQDDDYRWYWED